MKIEEYENWVAGTEEARKVMDNLKSCPFCGGPPYLEVDKNRNPHQMRVWCDDCGVNTSPVDWNNRTSLEIEEDHY